jgi:hypothetical protein
VPKRINPKLAKIHRSYTVEEVAGLFDAHKNTVRQWVKAGLPVCDDRRPTLILGVHLRDFLQHRKKARKRRCQADELFCMRCRAPKRPAGDMVDYSRMTATTGRLIAMCPSCSGMMNRYVSETGLAKIRAYLDVSIPKTLERIGDSSEFPVNSDFEQER